MFQNVNAEISRKGMTRKSLAEKIGCSASTLSLKLNGKSPLSFKEASEIKKCLGVDMPLEKLFEVLEDSQQH